MGAILQMDPVLARYESEREVAWSALAEAARQSETFRTAADYLGLRRAAEVAILERYLDSAPAGERARLEADAEYFVDRVQAIVRDLAPGSGSEHFLARAMAAFLHAVRGRGAERDRELHALTHAAIRISTHVNAALEAHDAYREFRCRVLPQTRSARMSRAIVC